MEQNKEVKQPMSLAELEALSKNPVESDLKEEEEEEKKDPSQKKEEEEEEKKKPEKEEEEEEEEEEKKPSKKESKKEEEEEEEEEEEDDDIYKVIGKTIGFEPEQQYEDNVAGYAKFAEDYGKHVISQLEANLKENYPNVYAYLIHSINGGKDEDFFERSSTENYWDIDLEEDDEATAEKIIRASLKEQGWNDKRIARYIEGVKDDEELYNEAKEIVEKKKKSVEEERKRKAKTIEEADKKNRELRADMDKRLSSIVKKGEIKDWIIPANDRENFVKYLRENIGFADGKFYITRPLDPDKLSEELQSEFFRFKKGDLKDLIDRRAKEVSVKKLKREIVKKKETSAKKETGIGLTLKDIF